MYVSRFQDHGITQDNEMPEQTPFEQEPNEGNSDVVIDLRDITPQNIQALKNVNQIVLSTTYDDDF